MPRRLSNPEYVQFLSDVDLNALPLPPWGAVVQWGAQFILVYICQAAGSLCQKGEAMLTDVSDRADLLRNIPGTYDTDQEVWLYQLPQETMARLLEVAQSTLQATGTVIQTVAETAGSAAGALTQPLLENLALPLVVIGIVYLLMESPRR
jgi:hypothetical protein